MNDNSTATKDSINKYLSLLPLLNIYINFTLTFTCKFTLSAKKIH